MIPSNHLVLCHPLLPMSSIFPSIKVFSKKLAFFIRWPAYWSFSISLSNEYSWPISLRIDCFDLLAVQGTLKILFQQHSLRASILWLSAFFMVQLSHPYLTTGKTVALTGQTFLGKMISLLLNMLSRLVIAFPPRSKHPLISWLQSLPTVILEPKKIKSVTVSTFSPSICHEVMGLDAMIFVFWMLNFKPAFHSLLSPSSRGLLVPLHFLLYVVLVAQDIQQNKTDSTFIYFFYIKVLPEIILTNFNCLFFKEFRGTRLSTQLLK